MKNEFFTDVLSRPHVLIAGATGTGKSVLINGLICQLISEYDHTEIGLILIDPKKVELIEYADTPHCIRYESDVQGMIAALEYAVKVIEKRLDTMQSARCKQWHGKSIYVIIDELADLMTVDKKAVTPLLQRIVQVGRAAAVHAIMATQCCLASVAVPTPIKCNVDTRIALRMACARDSRNILDCTGAEKLPPRGECLYKRGIDLTRETIPYIDDSARAAIIRAAME